MKTFNGEAGYVELLRYILENGVDIPDRTGEGCRAVFDINLSYGCGESVLSTVRSTPLRMAFEEFWMMLRGETHTRQLEEKGIYFWKPQTSREFLDSRNLFDLEEGDMGKAYGWQWRNFGGCGEKKGADQLKYLIDTLKNDKYSRRNVVTLWNPLQNDEKALTECWYGSQWIVLPNKSDGLDYLHCKLSNRSLDALYGCSFAIQQYRLLQICLCKMFNFQLGEISATSGHCHLYNNQLEYAAEFVERDFGVQGQVEVNKELKSLDDLLSVEWGDIVVSGLEVNKSPFKAKKPPMAV